LYSYVKVFYISLEKTYFSNVYNAGIGLTITAEAADEE
jgi:hypothetical protein